MAKDLRKDENMADKQLSGFKLAACVQVSLVAWHCIRMAPLECCHCMSLQNILCSSWTLVASACLPELCWPTSWVGDELPQKLRDLF